MLICHMLMIHFFSTEKESDKQETEEENINISRSGSSIRSKRLNDAEEDADDGEQDTKDDESKQEGENISNDYDTDVPITNLGVNNSSNTQSIASNLQGIAT